MSAASVLPPATGTSNLRLGPALQWSCILLVGTMLIAFGGVHTADAQQADTVQSTDSSVLATIERGVRAVESGRYRQAQIHLAPLATRSQPIQHPRHGTPAAWLGQAFGKRGKTAQARRTWMHGVQRARQADETAVDAADAFLQSLAPSAISPNLTAATYAFEHIVETFGDSVSTQESQILKRHAAQLALIVPDSIGRQLSAFSQGQIPSPALTIGSSLESWLQSQDPVLATEENERIREHLTRVRTAEKKYAWSGRPSGLDDRGETYVRLGRPERTVSVEYETSERITIPAIDGFKTVSARQIRWAIQDETGLSPSTLLTENEVWDYPEVGSSVHFFFIQRAEKDGNPYLEGSLREILPTSLRNPPSRTPQPPEGGGGKIPDGAFGIRNVKRWKAYFPVYRSIYEQLQFIDDRYGRRYSELRNYDLQSIQKLTPVQHLRTDLAQNRNQNLKIRREKEEQTPKQRTEVLSEHPSAPVAVRTARFLNDDGTTRLEVYWSGPTDGWQLSDSRTRNLVRYGTNLSGRSVVRTTGMLLPPSRDTSSRRWTDTLSTRELSERDRLITRSLTLAPTAQQRRLTLEWIQNLVRQDGRMGPIAHVTRKEFETPPALSAAPSELEMSDLRLVSVPTDGPPVPQSSAERRRRVIPFDRLRADRDIALNFEVYHLQHGDDDRTRYTVEYSSQYEREQGGIAGLFGGRETEETSTASTYQGTQRQTDEYILLELSEVSSLDAPTPVTVTVRVTDEVSGQTEERRLSFTLVPTDDS